MFFANEQRDNVREENPGISFGMIISRLPAVKSMLISSLTFQAKLARSSVRDGRHLVPSSASHTRPKPKQISSATKMRRLATMYVKLLSAAVAVELFLTKCSYRPAMKKKTRSRLLRTYR